MSYSRIGQTNPNNSLAVAMRRNSVGHLTSKRKEIEDNQLTLNELDRIRNSVNPQGLAADGAGRGGSVEKATPTDIVLEISRLNPNERNSNLVHSRLTEYFFKQGRTGLNKWQINAVVRQVMASRVSVTHEDIHHLEQAIRLKETKQPGGSKLSLNHQRNNSGASLLRNNSKNRFEVKSVKNGHLPSILKLNSPMNQNRQSKNMELPQHNNRNSAREIYLGNGSENNEYDGTFKVMDVSQVLIDEQNRNLYNQQNLQKKHNGIFTVKNQREDIHDYNSGGVQIRNNGSLGNLYGSFKDQHNRANSGNNAYPNQDADQQQLPTIKRNSIGILPSMNNLPSPKKGELPSLAEYGVNPKSFTMDSSIVQLKRRKASRLQEEAQRQPPRKSSLEKQFTDEVLTQAAY